MQIKTFWAKLKIGINNKETKATQTLNKLFKLKLIDKTIAIIKGEIKIKYLIIKVKKNIPLFNPFFLKLFNDILYIKRLKKLKGKNNKKANKYVQSFNDEDIRIVIKKNKIPIITFMNKKLFK